MKGWLFCVICAVFGVCTLLLLLFLEQRFHFKQWLINHLRIGRYLLIVYLAFFALGGCAVYFIRGLDTSPIFLGILMGIFCFLSPKYFL